MPLGYFVYEDEAASPNALRVTQISIGNGIFIEMRNLYYQALKVEAGMVYAYQHDHDVHDGVANDELDHDDEDVGVDHDEVATSDSAVGGVVLVGMVFHNDLLTVVGTVLD